MGKPRRGKIGSPSKSKKSKSSYLPSSSIDDIAAISGIKTLFKKPYTGDVFSSGGDQSGGILYLSRMNPQDDPVEKKKEDEKQKRAAQKERARMLEDVSR
tara:strand:+ start:525 stop:824 length:300 start_codon:yes stop_codon:yes gene_type:complete